MRGHRFGGRWLLYILIAAAVAGGIYFYYAKIYLHDLDVQRQRWINQRIAQATKHPETMDTVERLLLVPDENESQNIIQTINELVAKEDEKEAWKYAGALAVCGGPAAAEFLAAFYDAHTVKQHVDPPPPYPLPDWNVYDPFNREPRFRDWDHALLKQNGVTYCAFLGRGPGHPYEISSAMDSDSDGLYEAVYYTGLQDTAYYAWHTGMPEEENPQERLELHWEAGAFIIKHHSDEEYLAPNSVKVREYPGNLIVESRVSLAALKLDTDGDGLTDVLESLLHTDPSATDTDGDGLEDACDPHPRDDPAQMDRLARGVARAFTCLQGAEQYFWNTDTPDNQPQQYCFLDAGNVPGIAWAPAASVYGVSGNRFSFWAGYIHTFWLVSKAEAEAGPPEHYSSDDSFNEFAALDHGQQAFAYVNRDRIECVLHCLQPLQQEILILVDVDGELYPATVQVTGVS